MLMDASELLFPPLSYEKRVVIFFDFLGWRSELTQAGSDPRKIARLAAAVRALTLRPPPGLPVEERVEHATFSDNVCNSFPYDPDRIQHVINALAAIQYGLALQGFWLRGALTVGELYHDHEIVFGPALVRAHHLESKIANSPRILIDRDCKELSGIFHHVTDEDHSFIDPWTVNFFGERFAPALPQPEMIQLFSQKTGAHIPHNPATISGNIALQSILERIIAELGNAPDLDVFEKHRWLYDHISPRLGRTIPSAAYMPAKLASP